MKRILPALFAAALSLALVACGTDEPEVVLPETTGELTGSFSIVNSDGSSFSMDAIKAIRNIKAEKGVVPSKKIKATILSDGDKAAFIKAGEPYLMSLANLSELTYTDSKDDIPADSVSAVIDGAEIYVPLDDLVDYKEEFERLTKEKKRLEGEVKRSNGMLSNPGFVSKAPEAKIQAERDKLVKYEEMLDKVTKQLESVSEKLK